MCGFAALFEPGRQFSSQLLSAMSGDLVHRGPDSDGILSETGWALAFRRLAIMDPESRSDQPMTDREGRYVMVFNGEIYNFRELRRELIELGMQFNAQSDSETVLNGFLAWKEDVFTRLEGMFACVIVDTKEQRAIAARDPFGIKPLYLRHVDNNGSRTVAFASEVRPLARLKPVELDPDSLAELLTFTWAAGRRSNYKGIDRIPGGTIVTVDFKTGDTSERRFADPLATLAEKAACDEDRISENLEASIEAHMMSDVGYSLQLSGGVDSSYIAGIVSKHADRKISTFAVRLDDDRYDEKPFRDMVARSLNLDHHEIELSGKQFADELPDAVGHMEGPVPHGGCVMLKLLCREIAKTSKVVLTGEGADEMFGGYLRYGEWQKLKRQEQLGGLLGSLPVPPVWPFLGILKYRGLDAAAHASVYRDFKTLSVAFPDVVPPPVSSRSDVSKRFTDFRDRLFAVDQFAYLESLLVRQDKMAMSESVEARVPFVHWPLAKILNAIPNHHRVPGNGETKPILKRIAAKILPHDAIYRRKVGLRLPYNDWCRDEQALGRYLDLLIQPDSRLSSFGGAGMIKGWVDEFRRDESGRNIDLFHLVNLEIWLRSIDSLNADSQGFGAA